MDGMNANARESRKKFLAPLLVLMLCVVSLTGAAYAYSASSVTVINNTVTGDEYVLQVYDKDVELISASIDVDGLRIFSETNVGGDANQVAVKAETSANNTYTGKLTLKDSTVKTTAPVARTISVSATPTTGTDMTVKSTELSPSPECTVTGQIKYTVTCTLYQSDETGAKTNTVYEAGDEIVFRSEVATLWYVITIGVTSESTETGIVFNNNTPEYDVGLVTTQLAKETYKLVFTAAAVA